MVYRYVPILRWKRGERVGIQYLSPVARQDVIPLFILGTDQYVGRAATKKHSAVTPSNVTATELSDIWGAASFYIDGIALPTHAGIHHPITDIATSARKKGLNLIPATRLYAPATYQTAVDAIVRTDKRGVALHVDLNEFTSVSDWIGAWPYGLSDTDLIVDFSDSVGTVNALGAALNPAFMDLHQGSKWRSVTMSGTSIPENFSGFVAGKHIIKREEFVLWKRLSALSLPYRLDFGDYATVSVTPPPGGIKWGYPINVKYTLPQEFLICRGVNTTGLAAVDSDIQLIGHAKKIVAHPGRGKVATCWGDDRIDAIAAKSEGPQGLEHWVRIGVNRHIEVTRHHLP